MCTEIKQYKYKSKKIILLAAGFMFLLTHAFAQKGVVNNGAKIIIENGAVVKITGSGANFTNASSGTNHGRIDSDGKIELKGNWVNNATSGNVFINSDSYGLVVFSGTSAQSITGTALTAFEGLTLDNTSGLGLSASASVRNVLSLIHGSVILNSSNLTIGTGGSISGAGATYMIITNSTGALVKSIGSTGNFTFPIGEMTGSTEYSPVNFNLVSHGGLSSAYVSARVTDAILTENTSPSEYISRYWTLGSSGITSPNYSADYTYQQTDVVGTEASIYSAEYNGATRTVYSTVNAATNKMSFSSMSTFAKYTGVDGTVPTVLITCNETSPTNENPIGFTATFSETVSGFAYTDITIGNGSTGAVSTSDNKIFTFNVTPTLDGEVTVNIGQGVCTDVAGNENATATQCSVTYDSTNPTITITSSEPNPTNTVINFTVTFNETVTGFASGDITVVNGTVTGFTATTPGKVWNVIVTPSSEGLVTVNIGSGVATDAAGNGNDAASEFSRVYDITSPGVSLSSVESSPTNSIFELSIVFTEGVEDFALGDLVLGNCYADNLSVVKTDTSWTVDIDPIADGAVTVNLPAAKAYDYAGNPNTAATEFSIVYDGTSPGVTISSTEDDPTNSSSFSVSIVFTENVTGFTSGDITVSANCNKGALTGSGASYSLVLLPQTDGVITVDIASDKAFDTAGNGNTAATQYSITFDKTDPSILSVNPPDEESGVALSTNLEINFNEIVYAGSGNISLYKTSGNVLIEAFDVTSEISGSGTTTITVVPTNPLESLTDYYILIDATAFDDVAGNSFAGISSNSVWNFTSIDANYPQISSLSPADNATNVAINTNLVITFNEGVKANTGNITLYNSSDVLIEQFDVTSDVDVNNRVVTIDPTFDLNGQTGYYVLIDNDAIQDSSHNAFPGISSKTQWNFTTADITAPVKNTVTPTDNATDVSVSANLLITFSENVVAGSGKITIWNATTASQHEQINATSTSISANQVTINPTIDFNGESNYYVLIDGTAFRDASNNYYAGISDPAEWNFTTEDVGMPTVVVSTGESSPTNSSSFEIAITFSEQMQNFTQSDISITNCSLSGFDGTSNPVFTVNVSAVSDGNVLIQIPAGVAQDLSGNPNQISNELIMVYDGTKPDVAITTGTTGTINTSFDITITFTEEVSGFSDANITVTNATISNFAVQTANMEWTATVNPTADGTVTVKINADEVADDAGNTNTASNQISVEYDATAPTISSKYPENSATDIPVDANLQITFSEIVTIGTGYISLYKSNGTLIEQVDANTVSGDGTSIITIDLVYDLESETEYYVLIDAGAFTDEVGNDFAGISSNTAWTFTSADIIKPTINSIYPADEAINIALNEDLVITFSETVYKNMGNVTIYRVSDEQIHETIDITTSQVTIVDNVVTINPSVNFEVNTEYYIMVDQSSFQDESGNFFDGIITTTYWNFTAEDNINPVISNVTPADDATGISTSTDLVIEFSEEIVKGTGNITIVNLTTSSNHEVIDITSGQVVLSSNYVTITPSGSFNDESDYYVLIDATAFDDLVGNSFAGITDPTIWNFTTGDETAPEMLSISPEDNSGSVDVTTNLVITFNENVVAGNGNVTIFNSTTSANHEIIDINSDQVAIANDVLTINPATDFDGENEYYVLIDNGAIEDATGNAFIGITATDQWNFTTEDIESPTVTITSTASGTVTGNFTVTITFSEVVTGFTSDDISLTNADIATFTETTAGLVWNVELEPVTDGTVTVDVNAGVATDAFGNPNLAASQFSVIYDSGVGIEEVVPFTVDIYSIEDKVIIEIINENNYAFKEGIISIYNSVGQKIVTTEINDFNRQTVTVEHASHIYIVKLVLDKNTYTKRVFLE